jgi:hypothetical protein
MTCRGSSSLYSESCAGVGKTGDSDDRRSEALLRLTDNLESMAGPQASKSSASFSHGRVVWCLETPLRLKQYLVSTSRSCGHPRVVWRPRPRLRFIRTDVSASGRYASCYVVLESVVRSGRVP